jgi:hypothetical protein
MNMDKRVVISSSFSLGMISNSSSEDIILRVKEINLSQAREIVGSASNILSIVGHEATSRLLSVLFGKEIQMNRISYSFTNDDVLLIFQLLTRLPEGAVLSSPDEIMKLPFKFYLVELIS